MKTLVSLIACAMVCLSAGSSSSAGPDVILGEIDGSVSAIINDDVFAGFGTTSCNAGDMPLQWTALPSNEHPVIGLSLYRLADGRLEQLGQSWVKHGVFALEQDICNLGCQATGGGNLLGPGCSDPYGATMNRGPKLGSRSEVNPVTGNYDGAKVKGTLDRIGGSGWERSIQLKIADVVRQNAKYFVEGQYITRDDAIAGNGLNNVSYRQFDVIERNQRIFFASEGETVRERPAIYTWDGAELESIDTPEAEFQGKPILARVIVASKATRLTETRYRYDYAVFNMNSERGIGSLNIAIAGSNPEAFGFHAPTIYEDGWSQDPWKVETDNGKVVWSTTQKSAAGELGNPVRWGSMYNFWFEAEAKPVQVAASAGKYSSGEGPDAIQFNVLAPGQQ